MKLSLFYVVLGSLFLFQVDAVKKELMKEISVCSRNSPDLSICFCDNANRVLPFLNDGRLTMSIPPLDPIKIDFIKLELPSTKSVNLNASLYDVMVYGISKGKAVGCDLRTTENGIQVFAYLNFAQIALKSNYSATGKFLLFTIASDGDFNGEFADLKANAIWNSTRVMKNGKEYLKISMSKMQMEIKTMKVHLNNVFGNNTELNDSLNEAVNSNIHLFYEEIKPVVLEAIQMLFVKVFVDFFNTFPYDVLFPND